MLGKLLKHEWKGTYRVGCLMLILLAGITFLGWLAFQSPMWRELSGTSHYYRQTFGMNILNLVSAFTLILYFLMLCAVSIGIVVYLGVHFYKTMYTDEGYLTHTLPVTEGKLLFAKTLVSGIWVLIVSLGIILSVAALMMFLISAVLPEGYGLGDFWREFRLVFEEEELKELFVMFKQELGMDFRAYFIYMIVMLPLGAFTSVMTLFGAISLGQIFTKHRVLMAVASYIFVNMVSGIVSSVIQGITTGIYAARDSYSDAIVGSYINTSLITELVLSVVFAALLYLLSYWVNTRRLNLE